MRVVTLFLDFYPCEDVHLTKDCGLIPFLLYKIFGFESVLVTVNPKPNLFQNRIYGDDETSTIEKIYPSYHYVEGLKFDFHEILDEAARIAYVIENAETIDILNLIGPYEFNWQLPY